MSANHTMLMLWAHLFGDEMSDNPRFIGLVSGNRDPDNKLINLKETYYAWPDQAVNAAKWVERELHTDHDTFHCAHLLTARKRIKANAAPMRCLWAEWDGPVPEHLPSPTAIVQSSEGKNHVYWQLDRWISPEHAQELNKRIAYAFAADHSGWDLTQLLRPAATRNYKYESAPTVELTSIDDAFTYNPDDLDNMLPELPAMTIAARPAVTLTMDDQDIIVKIRGARNGAKFDRLYAGDDEEHGGDKSAADLAFVSMLTFYTDDVAQILRILQQSDRWREKWERQDYQQRTIDRALKRTDVYDPQRSRPVALLTAQQLMEQQCATAEPLSPTNVTPDGSTYVMELARIADLEQALAAAHEQLALRDAKIERLQEQIRIFNDEKRVRQNPKIKAERDTAIELAHAVAEAQYFEHQAALAEGREPSTKVKIPAYRTLAERMGCSESKISRDIGKLKKWFLIDVDQKPKCLPAGVDQKTGEIRDHDVWITETYVSLPDRPANWLSGLQTFEPDREGKTHGGSRVRCPHHPNAAVIVTKTCAVCEMVLDRDAVERQQSAEYGLQPSDCILQGAPLPHTTVEEGTTGHSATGPCLHDANPAMSAEERYMGARGRYLDNDEPDPDDSEVTHCQVCSGFLPNAEARKRGAHRQCLSAEELQQPWQPLSMPSVRAWGGND